MVQTSADDRITINHPNATISSLKRTIAQVEGLADALELQGSETLNLTAAINRTYSIHLARPVHRETLYVSSYTTQQNRKNLIDAFLGKGRADEDNSKLRNVISARLSSGKTQEAWQYRCHPILLALLKVSKITPAKFIAGMKGHIGQFRTIANRSGFPDGRRRNFCKMAFPIEYEAKGGEIILTEIKISDEIEITFRNNKDGQAACILIGGQEMPETVCDGMIGQGLDELFDDSRVSRMLAGETVTKFKVLPNTTVLHCDRRGNVPMADGGEIIDQETDRIIAKLYAWAEKDPYPADDQGEN